MNDSADIDEYEPTTDEVAELRPLRLLLTGLLCAAPVALLCHQYGLGLALLILCSIGIFLLKRIPQCMREEKPAIVMWSEVERVLKLVLIAVGIGLAAFACYLFALPSTRSDNTATAINTLRNIAAAQSQYQAIGALDRDGDGIGEFGYFAELAGGRHLRPPVLPDEFADVTPSPRTRGGVVRRAGYIFQMFLSTADGTGAPEAAGGGKGRSAPDTNRAEREWCCYAWPSSHLTGKRAFFVNQTGIVLMSRNRTRYFGDGRVPKYDAAFAGHARASLASTIAANASGRDGELWKVIN